MTTGEEFMKEVFEQIKHGDQAHQDWLSAECNKMADLLDVRINDLIILYMLAHEGDSANE